MTREELINAGWKCRLCKIGSLYFKDGYFCRFKADGNLLVFSEGDDMNPIGEAQTMDDITALQKKHELGTIRAIEKAYELMVKAYEMKYGETLEVKLSGINLEN